MGEADGRMAKKVRDKLMEEVVMMSKMVESSRKMKIKEAVKGDSR